MAALWQLFLAEAACGLAKGKTTVVVLLCYCCYYCLTRAYFCYWWLADWIWIQLLPALLAATIAESRFCFCWVGKRGKWDVRHLLIRIKYLA